VCCIGSAFCDGLIIRSGFLSSVWLIVCDLETSIMTRPRLIWGVTSQKEIILRHDTPINFENPDIWKNNLQYYFFSHILTPEYDNLSSSLPQVCRPSVWQKCPPDGVYCNHGCIMQEQFTFKERGMYLSRLHQSSFLPVFVVQWTHSTWPNLVSLRCILVLSANLGFEISCVTRSFNYPSPFPSP